MTAQRLHAATYSDAILALEFMLGWAGGLMPVEREREDRVLKFWHPVGGRGAGARLVDRVRKWEEAWTHEIRFGLPHRDRDVQGVTWSTVLWARVEGGEQVQRARAFRPLPTLVLQEGTSSRRLLLWSLEEQLDWVDTLRLNKRIAYRLRAVQKWADPDLLRVPAPGTFIRWRRESVPGFRGLPLTVPLARPVPVVVGRLTGASYRAGQVAGRLKDPPEVKFEGGQVVVERGEGSR